MNRFGTLFSVSVFGESHGSIIGVTIDGCLPGIKICEEDFINDINRRKGGIAGTTSRVEDDVPEILSGVFNGFTTGSPLTIIFRNKKADSASYSNVSQVPRPGHADYTAKVKFKGYNDFRGGGHFSGRMTLALVAAGVIAKKICKGISFNAEVIEAGGSANIQKSISVAAEKGNSIGGLVECRINGLESGFGEPFFNSVESLISHIVFSIPGIKGIEFGSGFRSAVMSGSEHNDVYVDSDGTTATNNSGGVSGGISNGNEIIFRIAVKPTSSISLVQETLNFKTGKKENLQVTGRHDTCIALRVPVIVEASAAIVLADLLLMSNR